MRSLDHGNYLGCLELLAEYDPFLAQHIERLHGNSGRGNPSYLQYVKSLFGRGSKASYH